MKKKMKKNDFKGFNVSSKFLRFSEVPYTKVFHLRFTKSNLHLIEYKTSHSHSKYVTACIGQTKSRTRKTSKNGKHPVEVIESKPYSIKVVTSQKQKNEKQLAKNKMDDLRSMLHLMPAIDREYYNAIGVSKWMKQDYLA